MSIPPNTYIRESVSKIGWEEIQDLALRAQGGDQASYKLFLKLIAERYFPKFRRLLPTQNVDDAIQELLMAIHKAFHTYDSKKSITPWLNAIAYYKVQDQLREVYKLAEQVELENNKFDETPGTEGLALDLSKLMSKLTERERKIVQMLKVDEFSVEEIATQLKLTSSNVKILSFRAMHKLRSYVAEEEFHEN